MSTPPVLAKSNGNCTEYKPECIEDKQRYLFYTALGFTSVGMAGHMASLPYFIAEQMENVVTEFFGATQRSMGEDDVGCCKMCCLMSRPIRGFFLTVLIAIVGILVVSLVKAWSVQFGVCALFALASLLVYISGVRSYNYVQPNGSAITVIFRVFVAAFSKMFCRRPQDVNDLHENRDVQENVLLLPHTNCLRCLDKAAIVLQEPGLEQQSKNRWRLCRVTEVEGTKIAIRMIPLWITLIFCGVVSAIGDTYFLEQAKTLNPKVGRLKVPLIIFLWFYDQGRTLVTKYFVKFVAKCIRGPRASCRRYVPPVGVAVGMAVGILCCIIAGLVESKRLKTVESNGLIDKPNERVPMTVFWLLPQFLLLGGLDGIREWSVSYLVIDQAPPAMIKYFGFFVSTVFGIGMMGSALAVHLVGKISEEKSGISWFRSTLNTSRLDKYYWVLAALSAANLCVYIIVASFYRYKDVIIEELQEPEYEETETNLFQPGL
ncbi:protein NRT1/ PTR FAMILY 5.5-like [Silene latifolia]|uniref:protein NRT1/ PTR FAMILY 5.5-like n=1 Tax=Silene latifolia TaxID=37657 RepID=UPI003D76F08E